MSRSGECVSLLIYFYKLPKLELLLAIKHHHPSLYPCLYNFMGFGFICFNWIPLKLLMRHHYCFLEGKPRHVFFFPHLASSATWVALASNIWWNQIKTCALILGRLELKFGGRTCLKFHWVGVHLELHIEYFLLQLSWTAVKVTGRLIA